MRPKLRPPLATASRRQSGMPQRARVRSETSLLPRGGPRRFPERMMEEISSLESQEFTLERAAFSCSGPLGELQTEQ
eukprot:528920-Pyramimonas_sp.AAC.1